MLPPRCISPASPPCTLRDVEPKWAFVETEEVDFDKTGRIFPVAPHAARNTRRDLSVWRTTIEDMHSGPVGPQLYLLFEEGYEGLKHLQTMLTLMAHITCNEENDAQGNATLTIGRAELCFIFQAINVQIGDVLERLGNENWLGTQSHVWQ